MDQIGERLKQAADLVKELPDHLQAAALPIAFNALPADETTEAARRGSSRRKRAARKKDGTEKKRVTKKRKVGGRTALRDLADGNYFTSPRSIVDIIAHLDTKKAMKFKQSDLSSHLAFLTREGTLEREKDSDGVYIYQVPK